MLHRDEAITEASESVYFYGGRTSGASGEGVTVAQGVPRDKGGQRGGQAGRHWFRTETVQAVLEAFGSGLKNCSAYFITFLG